jgi:hypothetical protein
MKISLGNSRTGRRTPVPAPANEADKTTKKPTLEKFRRWVWPFRKILLPEDLGKFAVKS